MSLLQSVLAGIPGLALGGLAGVYLGGRVRGRSALAWVMALVLLAIGVVVSFLGNRYGVEWLTYTGVGWMAGAVTGVRHGYKPLLGPTPEAPAVTHGPTVDGSPEASPDEPSGSPGEGSDAR